MARERNLSVRAELLRLLHQIELIPQRPVGPHLDEEDLIGLTQGSLSKDRREAVFEHIRSCAECAGDAVNAPEVLAAADAARRRAAARAGAAGHGRPDEAPAATARHAAQLVWMVAATAVWAARRRAGVVRLKGSGARDAASPKFEWAIEVSGNNRILRVRTRDREWQLRPVHCAVYDTRTDRNAAEAWVMLFAEGEEGYVYGETRLTTRAPASRQWRAEVRGYEAFDQLPPESVKSLRRAFSEAVGAERQAWGTWLAREVGGGRLTSEQVTAISGKQP